jgi:hypothetical protein
VVTIGAAGKDREVLLPCFSAVFIEQILFPAVYCMQSKWTADGGPMNFQSISYFIVLAREKNFTRAAEKLHMTQQALSASMASLEKEWGMPFFLRHVPLELTNGGRFSMNMPSAWRMRKESFAVPFPMWLMIREALFVSVQDL